MKIKTKLLLALSTLPIFLIILLITGMIQRSILDDLSGSLQDNYDLTTITEQIHRDIKDEGISLRNLVLFNDEQSIQEELVTLENESEQISENIGLLESVIKTEAERSKIAELRQVNNEFNTYKNDIISYVEAGQKEQALQLIDENSKDIHSQFFALIKEISTSFETNMDNEIEGFTSSFQQVLTINVVVLSVILLVILYLLIRTVWKLISRLNSVAQVMRKVANGDADLTTQVEDHATDEIGEVAQAFNRMTTSLEEQMQKEQELTWAKSNIANITTSLSGTHDLESLAQTFLSNVVPLVKASHAVFYVKDLVEDESEPIYRLLGSYAFKERKHLTNTFLQGEGLVGQAALEKKPIILTDVPSDYIQIKSGLGGAAPANVYVLPIQYEGDVKAVLEIASFTPFTASEQVFLEDLIEDLGIILESVMGRIQLAKLLEESQALMEETQAQAEELQTQQEELRATNEELEEQTQALKQSEEKLQMQQEELEEINADLEEKTKNLEEQNRQFERKNREVEAAKMELEEKAEQLALSSKYKSEFLANMSHELRTPLNSLLILSKLLADNKEGNLTAKQVEFSSTIYSSGHDLLALINDILDLAKIESGKVEILPNQVNLNKLVEDVESNFRAMAEVKGLDFTIELQDNLPTTIYSDEARIQQVLKNLLSNAFKFTESGGVTMKVKQELNRNNEPVIAFAVTDTGIGIPKDKQGLIFEAFQQADGTTNRKYGGTGLGLSISKETVQLLGGEITVDSVVGQGSTFTLRVGNFENKNLEVIAPISAEEAAVTTEITVPSKEIVNEEVVQVVTDNFNHIKRVLIVDDDQQQRNSLMELIGDMDIVLKAVSTGTEAMEELKVSKFDCMILDLGLTDTNGFELLEKVKAADETANVKVIVYTGRDLTSKEEMQLTKYAHSIIIKDEHSPERLKDELGLFLSEPAAGALEEIQLENNADLTVLKGKHVLLVDDDVRNVFALSSILEQFGMKITFAENGVECLNTLHDNPNVDIVLMDIMMPEMDGYESMRQIRSMPKYESLPIIALTAKAMKEDREKCLQAGASDYIVKPIDTDRLLSLIKVWLYQQEGK
ncbi:response regulator [Ornithinibacillus contaminans]|uniref:response regulator n=1 Tax=Ornithinibacillus contaminans TaxID=694055 RepID=UPI00064DA68E|nr:response regulator [Ornithinibacillus contaminans]